MKLICTYCKKSFERTKVKKAEHYFCCREHHTLWRQRNIIETSCLNCGKPTTNPKFCNKSCAASYNGRKFPKRTKNKCYCKVCGIEIAHGRTVCDDHNKTKVDWSSRTLGSMLYTFGRRQDVYAYVRAQARRVFKNLDRPKVCENCGYSKYYEVCHIKSINSFDMETPVTVINSPDNLIGLCPNCHWELDHGKLTLEPPERLELPS